MTLKVRPATIQDAELLFGWRNDPQTRANSINTGDAPWEGHLHWLRASLKNPDRQLLVAERDGVPVGTVRIDGGDELSWTVAPEHRGVGLGSEIVALVAKRGDRAQIKCDNFASQRIAKRAGFVLWKDEPPLQEWRKL